MENEENSDQNEIARLTTILTNQSNEINELNKRLTATEQHYETIVNRQKDEFLKEKQLNVMRYAQSEKAKLDSDRRAEILLTKTNELTKEKENLQTKFNEIKNSYGKLQQSHETKVAELTIMKKDLDKLKELNQSIDSTLISTLNHLKGETQQLREQREFNEKLQKELQQQKEINEQLNQQLQSVPTDEERTENHQKLLDEFNLFKEKFQQIENENVRLIEKLKSLDEDRLALENVIENYRENSLKEKENNKKLFDDLIALREENSKELSRLKQIESSYNQTLADNEDLRELLTKEHHLLALTQTLTEKNSILQSDYEQLQINFQKVSNDFNELKEISDQNQKKLQQYNEEEKRSKEEFENLREKFQLLNQSYENILKQNEDYQTEIITLKKKHQANTKDLIKQIQQLQKTKQTLNEENNSPSQLKSNSTNENSSNRGSRTSSISSLNENNSLMSEQSNSSPINSQLTTQMVEEPEVIVNIVDIDKQKLIDKLLKQQKLLVRRNEKIEFLNDHIQILTQDLQNKRRIIQCYAMNEESFMYTSNQSDSSKQELVEKSRRNSSSLMATLYNRAKNSSTHKHFPHLFPDQSSSMTLETALDIMGKLQSVLEDTLLKNLTLKENVDTLSQEIERLTKRTKT